MAGQVAVKVVVITGRAIAETGSLTWAFMMKPQVPWREIGEISGVFGYVRFKDDYWFANVMRTGQGQVLACSAPSEQLDLVVEGLVSVLSGMVLLMSRSDYDIFAQACRAKGIEPSVHHIDGLLATSE